MDTKSISEGLSQSNLVLRLGKPKPSPFLNLPPEIYLLITSNLPLESNEYLQPLTDAKYGVMNAFLHLLERDLPLHIICPQCNKLHFTPLAERHLVTERYCSTASRAWSECRAVDSLSQISGHMAPRFTSTIFFTTMKAHRQGRDTTALRLLSYKNIDDTNEAFVEFHISEARIRNGSLLIRDQKIFMLPAPLTHPLLASPLLESGRYGFCRHNVFTHLSDLYWCGIHVPSSDEIDDYKSKEGIIYCKYCHTEIRIDFKSYGKVGTAIFVTRWMDVGEGRDVNDVKWMVRLSKNEWLWEETEFERGSICAAFEGTNDFKFDSPLTQQDEMDLCAKCPLPRPECGEALEDEDFHGYVVIDGRLIFAPREESECFCIHEHQRRT